jgi:hypothetical protein
MAVRETNVYAAGAKARQPQVSDTITANGFHPRRKVHILAIPIRGAPRVKMPNAPTFLLARAFWIDAASKPLPRPMTAVLPVSLIVSWGT